MDYHFDEFYPKPPLFTDDSAQLWRVGECSSVDVGRSEGGGGGGLPPPITPTPHEDHHVLLPPEEFHYTPTMYPFPPPAATSAQIGAHRPPSASSAESGSSPPPEGTRYLPSLLTAAPFQPPPPAGVLPVQNVQLNALLHHSANLMAMNAQLRKEIEQVRAASTLKVDGGVSLPQPFFLSHDATGVRAAVAAAAAAAAVHATHNQQPLGSFPAANGRLPPVLSGRKSPVIPDSYKTVMCQAWLEASACSFGENCRFAHGEHELRPMSQPQRQNRKYKTKLCDKYTNTGLCPYGNRCLFIHPDIGSEGSNAYIRPDKLEELKKKQEERKMIDDGVGTETPSPPIQSSPPSMTLLQSVGGHAKLPLGAAPSIGVTPFRPRQSLRPHPSWPLEPASFFTPAPTMEEMASFAPPPATFRPPTMKSSNSVAAAAAEVMRLPRTVSPVSFDFVGGMVTPLLTSSMRVCPTPGSGCSGYGSDGGGTGSIGTTPASGTASGSSSGTTSPLAAFLNGSTHGSSVVGSPDEAYGASPPGGPLKISLPPMSSHGSGGWGADPFTAAIDIDNFARQMAKDLGL